MVENSGGVHLWVDTDTTWPKTGGVRTTWTPMDRRLCLIWYILTRQGAPPRFSPTTQPRSPKQRRSIGGIEFELSEHILLKYVFYVSIDAFFSIRHDVAVCDKSKSQWRHWSHIHPSECWGNYGATSNNLKLVHWPLMGGLLHMVQQGRDWAGP